MNLWIVIKKQICHTTLRKLRLQASSESVFCQALKSNTGSKAFIAVKKKIRVEKEKCCGKPNRKMIHTKSSVVCLQLFSDMSQDSLEGGWIAFYTQRIPLLKHFKKQRWHDTISWSMVCAYSPYPSKERSNDHGDVYNPVETSVERMKQFKKVELLCALLESVDNALSQLSHCVMKSLKCK